MNVEKIIKICLVMLLAIYAYKLRSKNNELTRAIKKISKSSDACYTFKYKCMNQMDIEQKRYKSIVIINAITVSTSLYIMSGHINEKCTFEVPTLIKLNKINDLHAIGEYDKIINLMEKYNLDPNEGMIPYQKLFKLFEDM